MGKMFILILLFVQFSQGLYATEKIRIACVGNSITYGTGIINRIKNSYPAQLQVYLGEKYDVKNFGFNDSKVLHEDDCFYIRTDVYKKVMDFYPDIVLIQLGVNDSTLQKNCFKQNFETDCQKLIENFISLPSKPRIILLSPIRCFLSETAQINNILIQNTLIPVIKEIVRKEKLEYVDIYGLMGNKYKNYLMLDGFHPSPIGAGLIAQKLYKYLKSENYDPNPCTHPICGNEYRSGAGWKKGADWHAVSEEISQITSSQKLDILFLGNSITQGFGGNRRLVTYKPGKAAADSCFANLRWESAGISGDRTETLLWRIRNGGYGKSEPTYVFITIGVNNIIAGHQVNDIMEGIKSVVQESKREFPDSKIVLFGLLPVGLEKQSERRQRCDSIHRLLKQQDWDNILYVNSTPWFTDEKGQLKTILYKGDHLHLTTKGYEVWCQHMKDILSKISEIE